MLNRGASASATLRATTGADHERVDAAFAGFDLADREGYRGFLLAHARALPAAEAVLAAVPGLPAFRPRTPLIAADLAAFGETMPAPLPFAVPGGDAGAWGALYVVEGSRLGGTLLARSVAEGWPGGYLGAKHLSGEWRVLLAALDEAAVDDAWTQRAVEGARATFELYRRAA